MNEHLFKLKKDGKTVGYVQLWHWGGLLYSKDTKFNPNTNKTRLPREIDGENITFHPFVCKDKNGKDVFEGDNTNFGRIKWSSTEWAWAVLPDDEMQLGQLLYECASDIELIEDKEDATDNT